MGLRRILDQMQAARGAELLQRRHCRRHTVEMHGDDRPGAAGDGGADGGGIDVAGGGLAVDRHRPGADRSEEHTSELQSLMRISYAVFCLKKKKKTTRNTTQREIQRK